MKTNLSYAYTPQFMGKLDDSVPKTLNMYKERYLKNISDKNEIDIINHNVTVLINNLKKSMRPLHEETVLEVRKNKDGVDSFFFTNNYLKSLNLQIEHFAGEVAESNKDTLNWDFYKYLEDLSKGVEQMWARGIACKLESLRNEADFNEIVNNIEQFVDCVYNAGNMNKKVFEYCMSIINPIKGEINADTKSTK